MNHDLCGHEGKTYRQNSSNTTGACYLLSSSTDLVTRAKLSAQQDEKPEDLITCSQPKMLRGEKIPSTYVIDGGGEQFYTHKSKEKWSRERKGKQSRNTERGGETRAKGDKRDSFARHVRGGVLLLVRTPPGSRDTNSRDNGLKSPHRRVETSHIVQSDANLRCVTSEFHRTHHL